MKSNFLMSLTPRAKSCKTTLAKLDLKPQANVSKLSKHEICIRISEIY